MYIVVNTLELVYEYNKNYWYIICNVIRMYIVVNTHVRVELVYEYNKELLCNIICTLWLTHM